MSGTKELNEILKAIDAFILEIAGLIKDGFQWGDLITLLQNLVSKPVYIEAVKGYKELVPEVKDLDVQEGIALLMTLLFGIPKYIDAFKKDPSKLEGIAVLEKFVKLAA